MTPDDGAEQRDDSDDTSSLVERAMRTAGGGRKPRAADGGVVAKSSLVDSTGNAEPVPAAETPAEASPAVPPHAAAPPQPPQPPIQDAALGQPDPSSRSRMVNIDFERLQTLGFLTPNGARSRTTEEFRLIKRSLLQAVSAARAAKRPNPNLFMVTSAGPSEGKTFNAVNLAISIASEPDLNALLIDADLINPSVFKTLGVESGRGLVDIIEGTTKDLSEVLVRTNIDGLSLLGAGTPHPMATELLASDRMYAFVDEIGKRYSDRIVIFDTPPVLATSEPTILAGHMSQLVFVVEAEGTGRLQIKDALDLIGPGPEIGMILNKARSQFGSRQFGAYYKAYTRSR